MAIEGRGNAVARAVYVDYLARLRDAVGAGDVDLGLRCPGTGLVGLGLPVPGHVRSLALELLIQADGLYGLAAAYADSLARHLLREIVRRLRAGLEIPEGKTVALKALFQFFNVHALLLSQLSFVISPKPLP